MTDLPQQNSAAALDTLVTLAVRVSMAQAEAFAGRLAGALDKTAREAVDSGLAEAARQAIGILRKRHSEFRLLLLSSLQETLQQAVRGLVDPALSRLERNAMDLSVSTFEAMQEKVLQENLADAIDKRNAAALEELGVRIEYALGRRVGAMQHPFRAALFISAVSDAWRRLEPDSAVHRVMLQQLRPEVFLQLDVLLQVLNRMLAAPPPAQAADTPAKPIMKPARRRGDFKAGGLQRWLTPRVPSHSRTMRDCELHPALLGYLTALQKCPPAEGAPNAALLHRVLQESPAGALGAQDRNAVELLAAAFDLICEEAPLSFDIKKLLERLQIPMLKAALTDKDFFFTPEHPARRLLEAVAQAGRACDPVQGRDDPLYLELERTVEQVLRDFIDRFDLFDHLALKLEAYLTREERVPDGKVEAAITAALLQEQALLAQREAEEAIEARIDHGDVAGFVEVFLRTGWVRVLATACRQRNSEPEAFEQALATMEKLIWSVKPKANPHERRELVVALPELLGTLTAALNAIDWSGDERDAFFAALAERHAAVARTPLEAKPRQQLEIALNLAQKISERRLQRQAMEQQEKSVDEFVKSVNALVPGSRVDFKRGNGTALRCRLSWVSPARTRFVFHARQAQQTFTLAAETLEQVLRNGQAVRVSTDDIMSRALSAALADLD